MPVEKSSRIHAKDVDVTIHAVNGDLYYDLGVRLAPFDKAVAALVEDIYDRGLDRKTMLIVAGEFLRPTGELATFIVSSVALLVILFFPNGFLGAVLSRRTRS